MTDLTHTKLELMCDTLTKQINAIHARFSERQDDYVDDTTVYDLVDRNGYPILAPLLVAKANVLCAIANLEKANE